MTLELSNKTKALQEQMMALVEDAYNQGMSVNSSDSWQVTQPVTEKPVEEKPRDLGKLKYKVGLVSDIHFDTQDKHNSEYLADFVNAMQYFRNQGVEFIANCGDMGESRMADLEQFKEYYTAHAWAPSGGSLRMFTAMGNHDCYLLQSKKFFQNGDDENLHIGHNKGNFCDFNGEGRTNDIYFFEYDGVWNQQYVDKKKRTNKSKLSYWVDKGDDIWVVLSTDYGTDPEVPDSWGLMSQACNHLDYSDRYVQQAQEYVKDTQYRQSEDGAFDYQFYNPNSLIWLKDIIENNPDKHIFIITHHFFPQKAGNGTFWTAEGNYYSRSRVYPYTDNPSIRKETVRANANTLCGLQFYFLNKLCNLHRNTVWFSGHTHYSWHDEDPSVLVCSNDYPIYKPDGAEHFSSDTPDSITQWNPKMYSRRNLPATCESAVTIHVPSLSRPVDRKTDTALYGASEGGLLEVYENGYVLRMVEFKGIGSKGYTNTVVGDYSSIL